MVIFSALAAVMAVLSSALPARPGDPAPASAAGIPVSPVVAFVLRVTAPFIAAFGAFVIFKGHVSPGGGFQGGVILGALLVLLSFVSGRGLQQPLIPVPLARWLQAAAPLAFAVMGVLGLAAAGAVLAYPAHHLARELMMITLELGIGIGGGAIILGLFLEMRGE
jgi:multicomponent Na+:H+ antiporter subunit B